MELLNCELLITVVFTKKFRTENRTRVINALSESARTAAGLLLRCLSQPELLIELLLGGRSQPELLIKLLLGGWSEPELLIVIVALSD